MDVRVGPWRRLSTEELMLLNRAVGEDSWESLGLQEIKSVNPKGNQFWTFIGRTDAEASILWPPDAKSWLLKKDPDAGKDWRQEKGTTELETVGWHHQFNGHEFEQAPRDIEGQESLVCCGPWGRKESDTTEMTELENQCEPVIFFSLKSICTSFDKWKRSMDLVSRHHFPFPKVRASERMCHS